MRRGLPFILSVSKDERSWVHALTMTGALCMFILVGVPGCSGARDRRRATELEAQVQELQREEDQLRAELARAQQERGRERDRLIEEREWAVRHAQEEKEQESQDLVEAQRRLAESLKKELGDARAKLAMTERGLVLTFLDEIFFDSGKAVIKEEGRETLDKVAQVLQEAVPESPVAVEGHTDNEPIRYSGWRSNWELSSGRALAVVHYFIERRALAPGRVRAVGFGEFHPLVPNDSPEGRRQNRRVELVILPKMSSRPPQGREIRS